MKKILTCIVVLFLSGNLQAQQGCHLKTLFEYGETLESVEANFRNLFQNFSKFVTNANNGIELLSYKYVTEIKNKLQIKEIFNKKHQSVHGLWRDNDGHGFYSNCKFICQNDLSADHQVNKTFLKDLKKS